MFVQLSIEQPSTSMLELLFTLCDLYKMLCNTVLPTQILFVLECIFLGHLNKNPGKLILLRDPGDGHSHNVNIITGDRISIRDFKCIIIFIF